MKKLLTLTEIQDIEFSLLCQFDDYCKAHGIVYYLAGGTLLGAIRHKGFIPWDDDIDLMLPRPDYERLLRMISRDAPFVYNCVSLGKGYHPFLKIAGGNVSVQEKNARDQENIWVDIFPIDGLPSDDAELARLYRVNRILRRLLIASAMKFGTGANLWKKFLKGIVYQGILRLFPSLRRRIGLMMDKQAQSYSFEDSEYVGGLVWGYGPQERMIKSEWVVPVEVTFNGRTFLAPKCWDAYLTGLYGDYRTLPPEEERKWHLVEAWIEDDSPEEVSG